MYLICTMYFIFVKWDIYVKCYINNNDEKKQVHIQHLTSIYILEILLHDTVIIQGD